MHKHYNFFKWFSTSLPRSVSPSSPMQKLKDAGGNSLGFRGVYAIPLTIMGKTVTHEVWVCDKVTDLIIGVDFIQIHKLAYDCTSRSVHWNSEPHAPVLTLREETVFEPLTTTLVTTKFLGKRDKTSPQIVSVFSIDDDLIQGGPALVNVLENGLCTIAVTNCAPYPITIKRGSVIGLLKTNVLKVRSNHCRILKLLKFLIALIWCVLKQPLVINGLGMKLHQKLILTSQQSFDQGILIFCVNIAVPSVPPEQI